MGGPQLKTKTMSAKINIPPVVKIIAAVVVIGGVAFGVYKTIKWIKNYKKMGGSRTDVNQSQSTLNTLTNQGIKPSSSPVQYSTWSNSLQQAFDGCGTGWATQLPIWKSMKNDADIHSLITSYGIRSIDKCGLGTGDFSGDLPSTLSYKYSGVEGGISVDSISLINKILKANGLIFHF